MEYIKKPLKPIIPHCTMIKCEQLSKRKNIIYGVENPFKFIIQAETKDIIIDNYDL